MPTHNSNFKVPAIIAIPLLFGLSMRFIFGLNSVEAIYSVMGLSFLFLVPFGIGALTIYLSSKENVSRRAYRVFMPWAPIGAFFLLTLLLGWEGWACWLMVLPLFLLAASLGGKVAARYKLRDRNRERIYVSLIALLPLVVSPAEKLIKKIPGQYRAYTYIDIHASKENIWKNVTRVSEIAEKQDKGWFTRMLGFPALSGPS